MAPKRVDRSARREEILSAAVRVFARQGFAATRIEDVAAEAGIAKGSVYLSFSSRDDLLAAAFARLADRSAGVLGHTTAEGVPAVERLTRLVRSAVAMLADEPELTRVMVDLWAAGRHRGDAAPLDMATVYREYRGAVAGLLREAAGEGDLRPGIGEPEATVVVGAIEGCLVQWLMDPAVPLAGLADTVVGVCLSGLRSDGAASPPCPLPAAPVPVTDTGNGPGAGRTQGPSGA
ncbi:TetR/AcrR family transcriptional regulator [Nocardiopsis sp. CT-R113]|uniref:TetR/AcrR family transcriptional regulator n=1 Tax=Nocardiopsis codii TaxID=3065942 RepID=A0ABU7KE65_9ACTN|nr:TetR/AcrR family transcriptional regulator [Nocardiopsis sp. CT-R113]MEE2040518.1 TetR/AcrR family transcriptional regulator [Nocardiopsis sp. CT-R113]